MRLNKIDKFSGDDHPDWLKTVEANQDGYGAAVMSYASRWANLMEQRMADGTALSVCAEKTSHDADTEGITGFMYGCAVSILARVWKHGEALRCWHNLDTQIGNEVA